MSIKKSLQSSMVLVACLPIIIFTVIAISIAFHNSNKTSEEAARAMAEKYQKGFDAQLNTQIVELNSLAANNDVISLLLKKYNDPSVNLMSETNARTTIQNMLSQASESFGSSIIYSVYDLDGYIICSSDSSLCGQYDQYVNDMAGSLDEPLINSSHIINGADDSIHILVPVSVKEKYRVGVMVASLSRDFFTNFISEDDNTYLLNIMADSLLGIPVPDEQVAQEAGLRLLHYDGSPKDLTGYIRIRNGLSCTLYGYSIMPEYHWIYLVKLDLSVYQSLIQSIPFSLLAVLLFLLPLTYLLSSLLAQKYCRPIFDLKQKMLQASNGDLDVHCAIESKDEFGELSSHFNEMMEIISSNYNELMLTKEQLEHSQDELQENYRQIKRLAYTDTLTGLANRVAFMEHAHNVFHHTGNFDRHAILFIDLDNFKNVNDTLGHDYGDLLLQQIADKITQLLGEDDLLARTGGDEFLLLRGQADDLAGLDRLASDLISIAQHPFELDGETIHVSMSIGIAIFPQNGLTVNELIKNADIAMYCAKSSGKCGYRFFNSSMEDEVNRKNEIEEILHNAIQNQEVYLLYQPQCDTQTGRIIGCEALMRIRNSYLGQISPVEFIPIAEESGIINELGAWALEHACDFNRQLLDAGFGPITMSVNVSSEQLKGDSFIPILKHVLEKTKLPPEYLELEVTESVLIQSFEHNIKLVEEIRAMGIHIALDDFGTGYSSFNYLTQIPIDTLKIDKSFVDNICTNAKDCFVAETIVSLAHKLNIKVVAEGVESSDQLKLLQENSCDILQGYLFSKPLPDEHYRNLLEINHDV